MLYRYHNFYRLSSVFVCRQKERYIPFDFLLLFVWYSILTVPVMEEQKADLVCGVCPGYYCTIVAVTVCDWEYET